ncbi:hypothetical protein NUW58_g5046 [Xylaria curta]|uniref:Uncharacterized protein n=1 Tax=Xylaria curta TaxID=42375 RepID=A0ACC1P6K0_9PEZI|nr:hypothetical protein NUW58_g5046 [Xylaria curta]
MPTLEGLRRPLLLTLLDAYGSLSVDKLLPLLAPNFEHVTLPHSLGMPVRDKDAFAKHAAGIANLFEEFKFISNLIADDPTDGVTVIEALMVGVLKQGKGEWRNECYLVIQLTKDFRYVRSIREFVDSAKAIEMAQTHAPKNFGWNTSNSSRQQK